MPRKKKGKPISAGKLSAIKRRAGKKAAQISTCALNRLPEKKYSPYVEGYGRQ